MQKIAFFDFDSTLVSKESLDTVIAHALAQAPDKERIISEIENITNRGMNGEIAFTESVQKRLSVLPLQKKHFTSVGNILLESITPGMPELFLWLKKSNVAIYIISGGFFESVAPTAKKLGVPESNIYTNRCLYAPDDLVIGPETQALLWSNEGKGPVIHHVRAQYTQSQAALVGDGANDLAAYTNGAVDYFCGFGGHVVRPKVQKEAPVFAHTTSEVQTWLAKVFDL